MGRVSEEELVRWHKDILDRSSEFLLVCASERANAHKSIMERKLRLIEKIITTAKRKGISQLKFGKKDVINKYSSIPIALIDFSICDKEAYIVQTGDYPLDTCLINCTNDRLVKILNYVETFNNGF